MLAGPAGIIRLLLDLGSLADNIPGLAVKLENSIETDKSGGDIMTFGVSLTPSASYFDKDL